MDRFLGAAWLWLLTFVPFACAFSERGKDERRWQIEEDDEQDASPIEPWTRLRQQHGQSRRRLEATRRKCAPWLPDERRQVLLTGFLSWEEYNSPGYSSHRGETYYRSAFEWAIRQNGFVPVLDQEVTTAADTEGFYRIILSDINESPAKTAKTEGRMEDYYDLMAPNITCKFRVLMDGQSHFDIGWWDPRQVFDGFSASYNTYVGYFAHSFLTAKPVPEQYQRPREGLIMSKRAPDLCGSNEVVEALLNDGFILHITCRDADDSEDCKCSEILPYDNVVKHGFVGAEDFSKLMKQVAFVLGMDRPDDSPSVLEALAQGAAFLNPIRRDERFKERPYRAPVNWSSQSPKSSQHDVVALLGMPYVYNIHLGNPAEVVQAANYAVQYRFHSFLPANFHPEAIVEQMCSMLEDDALCESGCPNLRYNFEFIDDDDAEEIKRRHNESLKDVPEEDWDLGCYGNTYVKW